MLKTSSMRRHMLNGNRSPLRRPATDVDVVAEVVHVSPMTTSSASGSPDIADSHDTRTPGPHLTVGPGVVRVGGRGYAHAHAHDAPTTSPGSARLRSTALDGVGPEPRPPLAALAG